LFPHNNFYQTLGVQKNATGQQIRDAFRKLSLENNPKNKPGCNETEHKFKEMCEAYNTLSNDKLRQNYDRLISSELPSELAYEQFNSTFGHGHF
jgi:DnaJ-class molecular chaperone